MIRGFHHVAIRPRDFEASLRFYTQGLGLKERIRWNDGKKDIVLLDVGNGNYIEVFENGKPDQPEGIWCHIALRTDDVDDAVRRVVAAGGRVMFPPKDNVIEGKNERIPTRLAFCRGPDGEIIEFFQNEAT